MRSKGISINMKQTYCICTSCAIARMRLGVVVCEERECAVRDHSCRGTLADLAYSDLIELSGLLSAIMSIYSSFRVAGYSGYSRVFPG